MSEMDEIKAALLASLRERPDQSMIQLATSTGLRPGRVWVGMSALRQEDRVKRFDNGWRVIDHAE